MAKALDLPVSAIRCIHAEGSGCYGHNAADDVALDAVLLARATAGRPVRVQWMRDDEFMWEPYGAAMVMRARAGLKDGRIVDWNYDVWSNTHNMRPGDPDGVNLLASWYLEKPKQPGPPRALAQPAGGGDRNAIPLYDLPNHIARQHLLFGDAPRGFESYYEINWRLIPNLALEGAVFLLHHVLSIDLSVRIFLALTVAQLFIGTLALHYALFGRCGRLPLAAALLPIRARCCSASSISVLVSAGCFGCLPCGCAGASGRFRSPFSDCWQPSRYWRTSLPFASTHWSW